MKDLHTPVEPKQLHPMLLDDAQIGNIVAFDCRERMLTVQVDEMPSGILPGHRLGARAILVFLPKNGHSTPKPKTNEVPPAKAVDPATPLFGTWQPIATIPDGVEVLATCGGICSPAVVLWSELEQCWIDGDNDDRRTERDDWPLTHWMPLPDPPNVQAHGDAGGEKPTTNESNP
jgi:hypothetical protein